jgi:hypothetical protein
MFSVVFQEQFANNGTWGPQDLYVLDALASAFFNTMWLWLNLEGAKPGVKSCTSCSNCRALGRQNAAEKIFSNLPKNPRHFPKVLGYFFPIERLYN